MERDEHQKRVKNKRMKERKRQDAANVLSEMSSVPDSYLWPTAEEEQQCENILCKEKLERLQRECNELREGKPKATRH